MRFCNVILVCIFISSCSPKGARLKGNMMEGRYFWQMIESKSGDPLCAMVIDRSLSNSKNMEGLSLDPEGDILFQGLKLDLKNRKVLVIVNSGANNNKIIFEYLDLAEFQKFVRDESGSISIDCKNVINTVNTVNK